LVDSCNSIGWFVRFFLIFWLKKKNWWLWPEDWSRGLRIRIQERSRLNQPFDVNTKIKWCILMLNFNLFHFETNTYTAFYLGILIKWLVQSAMFLVSDPKAVGSILRSPSPHFFLQPENQKKLHESTNWIAWINQFIAQINQLFASSQINTFNWPSIGIIQFLFECNILFLNKKLTIES
jgi:hypothetical protein